MNAQKAKRYRLKFMPIFVVIALGTGLFGLLLDLILTGFDTTSIQWQLVPVIIFSVAWSLISTTALVLYFTITISDRGIKGFTFWGQCRFVEWKTIKECRTTNLIGLKHLKVFTLDNRLPLWVPLFLNHMRDFEEDIIILTDQGNCIRSYFETKNA